MDPTKGLFRRRPSTASTTQSRTRAQSSNANTHSSSSTLGVSSAAGGVVVAAQSCPTSPKHSPLQRRSVGNERIPEDEIAYQQPASTLTPTTSSEAAEYAAAIEDARREQRQQQQQLQLQRSPSRYSYKSGGRVNSMSGTGQGNTAGSQKEAPAAAGNVGNGSSQLQRSASTVSGFGVRPRSSPAGLHAYTGKCLHLHLDEPS